MEMPGSEHVQRDGGQDDVRLQLQMEVAQQGGKRDTGCKTGNQGQNEAVGEGAHEHPRARGDDHDPFQRDVRCTGERRDGHTEGGKQKRRHDPQDCESELG